MKPYVKNVLNLWKSSSETIEVQPYGMSQQLKNMAALFTPGLFYYYILDFPNIKFQYVHEGTREVLGIEPEDVTMEKLIEILAPDERAPMAKKESVALDFLFNFLKPEQVPFYKIVYFVRVEDVDGRYHDILHQATVLTLTESNKAKHVMVVHTDVSHLKFVKKDTISFISLNGDKSYFDVDIENGTFDPELAETSTFVISKMLTRREKEVVRLMANGLKADEIAKNLNISVHTVRTHKKNIFKKTCCKNTTELVARSMVEGLI